MPPATTTSAWPDWIIRSASMIVLMPDRQTLLMVVAGTSSGMPACDRGLAGGDLAGAGLQHLAHEDVVDVLGGHAGTGERLGDGEATEVRAAEAGERAGELADGRASPGQND